MTFPTSDLSPYQLRILESYPPNKVFALVSWGCAGTSWLAHILNSHPDIYCVHAANFTWSQFANAKTANDINYLRILGMQGYAAKLSGDVHGVSRESIPQLQSELGQHFRAGIIVREPFARIRSQISLMNRFSDLSKVWDISYIKKFEKSLGRDPTQLPLEDQYKIHAMNMLNAIIEEYKLAKIFRIEDISSSPDQLDNLIKHISSGTVSSSRKWLESALNTQRINSHVKRHHAVLNADDMKLLNTIVSSEAWEIYRTLGYDTNA